MIKRKISIQDYFLAYVYSEVENIQQNLDFVDSVIAIVGDRRPFEVADIFKVPGGVFDRDPLDGTRAIPEYVLLQWQFYLEQRSSYKEEYARIQGLNQNEQQKIIQSLEEQIGFKNSSGVDYRLWKKFTEKVKSDEKKVSYILLLKEMVARRISIQEIYLVFKLTDKNLLNEVLDLIEKQRGNNAALTAEMLNASSSSSDQAAHATPSQTLTPAQKQIQRVRAEKLYDEARKLHDDKEYELAIKKFEQAIATDSSYEWGHVGLSECYSSLKDSNKVVEVLRLALVYTETPALYDRLGDGYLEVSELQEAHRCYLKAIELDPKYHYSYYSLANYFYKDNNDEKAIEYCKKTLDIEPSYHYAIGLQGLITERRGNINDALKYFERAQTVANRKNSSRWDSDLSRMRSKVRGRDQWTTLPTTDEMIEYLNRFVCGQERAKIDLTASLYQHYLSLAYQSANLLNSDLGRCNVLLFGPSGCGKTYMIELLTKKLGVPLSIINAPSLVQTGYAGKKVDSIVTDLLVSADYNVARAERGIVFIDEIDKVHTRNEENDVSGEGVQNSLLRLLEGKEYVIEHDKGTFVVDTSKVLFIAAGAFDGIVDIARKRLALDKNRLGFGSVAAKRSGEVDDSDILEKVTVEDLEKYGMMPQLVGRFAAITNLRILTRDDLRRILTSMESSVIEKQKKYFEIHGISLEFDNDALEAILDLTNSERTGARGLRSALTKALQTVSWRISTLMKSGYSKITITRESIVDQKEPIMEKDTAAEGKESQALALREIAFGKLLEASK